MSIMLISPVVFLGMLIMGVALSMAIAWSIVTITTTKLDLVVLVGSDEEQFEQFEQLLNDLMEQVSTMGEGQDVSSQVINGKCVVVADMLPAASLTVRRIWKYAFVVERVY